MFRADPPERYAKSRAIYDNASDIHLDLDTDDVNPDDVSEEVVQRLVKALNAEFYP